MESAKLLLRAAGITKRFPGVLALNNVDFEVSRGEIHALVGANGAGKSTLVSILVGVEQPSAGVIEVDGRHWPGLTPHEAAASGIAYVPQHVLLMPSLSVAENILAGQLPTSHLGFVDWPKAFAVASLRLRQLRLPLDPRQPAEGLSVAEQTMLGIARALFSGARLIILDEPTAALARGDIDRLFKFIKQLRDEGVTFIYISHHIEEIFRLCDRVTVLRDGMVVAARSVAELTGDELVRLMIGGSVGGRQRAKLTTASDEGGPGRTETKAALVVDGLHAPGRFAATSFTVRSGELLGLCGLEGSGAQDVGMALFGLVPFARGRVTVGGAPVRVRRPADALRAGIAYVPQDRHKWGLVLQRSVRENISYCVLSSLTDRIGRVSASRERSLAGEYVKLLQIACDNIDEPISHLSGGNQQKVVFAKLAALRPVVFIAHEPTQGVDVAAKQEIYQILLNLADSGAGVVVISSTADEVLAVADRVLVMRSGAVAASILPSSVSWSVDGIVALMEGGSGGVVSTADS